MLANDVQETPAKGRHLLDGSPFGYDAHKGETQRTRNPLVAGSIPAGPTAISAGHVLYSDSPGDSKGADRTPRVCPLSARPLCPPDSLHSLPVCGAAPCPAPESGRSAARAISPPHLDLHYLPPAAWCFRYRPGP